MTTPTDTPVVVLLHDVMPPVPDTAKVIKPAGAVALVVPITVAVKTTEPPSVRVLGAEERTTLGVALATVVVEAEETTPTAL